MGWALARSLGVGRGVDPVDFSQRVTGGFRRTPAGEELGLGIHETDRALGIGHDDAPAEHAQCAQGHGLLPVLLLSAPLPGRRHLDDRPEVAVVIGPGQKSGGSGGHGGIHRGRVRERAQENHRDPVLAIEPSPAPQAIDFPAPFLPLLPHWKHDHGDVGVFAAGNIKRFPPAGCGGE